MRLLRKPLPKDSKKILYVANSAFIGGGNRSLLTNVKQLKRSSFEPVVIVPDQGPLTEELNSLGVKYTIIPCQINVSDSKGNIGLRVTKLALYLGRILPSIIHVNALSSYRLIASANLFRIPIICHIRFLVEPKVVSYQLRPIPNVLIFNSKFMREEFCNKNHHICTQTKHEIIYNGFDPKDYYLPEKRELIRAKLGLAKDDFCVGIIGNFAKEKGHEIFLKIAQVLSFKSDKFHFIVAGDDILEKGRRRIELMEMRDLMGLKERVKFLGFVENVGELLSALDALVVPSKFESFGRIAVEGLLAGIPVVAARVGGLVEILEDNPLGRLVGVDDILEFVRMLEMVFKERKDGRIEQRIINGRLLAAKRFGIERNFNKLLRVYNVYGNANNINNA